MKNYNNYSYDEENIAKKIIEVINESGDPNAVKYLNDERNRKIEEGGEATAGYKDDYISRAAESYIKSFEEPDTDKLFKARETVHADNLKKAYQNAGVSLSRGKEENAKAASNKRRLYLADANKKELDTEEALARLGLGKGVKNRASSGFGESARLSLLSDAAEKLNEIYDSERQENLKLEDDYLNKITEAEKAYSEGMDNVYKDKTDTEIKKDTDNKDLRLSLIKENNALNKDKFNNAFEAFVKTGAVKNEAQAEILGVPVGTTSVEYEKLAFEIAKENTRASEEAFNEAFKMFEGSGVILTQAQAEILGAPVGTQYWPYITGIINANASARSSQASALNAESNYMNAQTNKTSVGIDAIRAENERYKNETDRLRFNYDYGVKGD